MPQSPAPDFEQRLAAFDSRTFEALRPGQELVLAKDASDHLSTPDLAIEMPTGEGKTLVALLIADLALDQGRSVAYLTGTRQLAEAVEAESAALGLDVVRFASRDYGGAKLDDYHQAQAVGIMNYWVYFNSKPVPKPADLVIFDDAHLAEQPLSSLQTLRGLQGAVEEAKGFSSVLAPDGPSNAADVLCRGVLEASSLAWWLLDPEIDGPARLARSLVYRLQSAAQTQRAVEALGLEPEDKPSGYGELPKAVEQDIASVGLTSERRHGVLFCGQEALPSYTKRTGSLVAKIWPQEKLPYSVLSAVAHAELLGLQRNLVDSGPRSPGLQIRPGPATGMWLWQDTYLVMGSLIFTAERAAAFLGLHDQVAALQTWMQECQGRLLELRPSS